MTEGGSLEPVTDELLNGEIFYTLREAGVLIEVRRRHYNTGRPHSALDYRPPAPEAITARDGTFMLWPGAPTLQGARPPSPAVATGCLLQ